MGFSTLSAARSRPVPWLCVCFLATPSPIPSAGGWTASPYTVPRRSHSFHEYGTNSIALLANGWWAGLRNIVERYSSWRLRGSGCPRVQILQNCVANASASCACKSCRNCGMAWRAAPAARFGDSIQCAIPGGKGPRESGSLRIWSRPWAQ